MDEVLDLEDLKGMTPLGKDYGLTGKIVKWGSDDLTAKVIRERREDIPPFNSSIMKEEEIKELNDLLTGTFYEYEVCIEGNIISIQGRDPYSCIGQAFLKAEYGLKN